MVQNCERSLVVNADGLKLNLPDPEPKLERSAVQLLESYVTDYQQALKPHLVDIVKLRSLAICLRKLQPIPTLP